MSPLRRVGVIGCFLISCSTLAQESVTQETNAPGVKWYQINTPGFRILYPKGFDAKAQQMANTLETIREPEGKTMGVVPKKISVVLQNQSSVSNGFVTLAPRRSEFYTMPSQNYNFVGTNDWLNTLAVHEYRHMAQFQRSVTGFNKFIYYVFGQQALAGMSFVAAPQWFWEGDAVATETAFTQSGRGRIPNFDLLFKTNLMEGRTFNYHKQYLRSYKHNIPNHYVLGYNMVSYLRKKTNDPMIWEKIARQSWSFPIVPFSFSNAIKSKAGEHVTTLFDEMAAQRKKEYEKELEGITPTEFTTVTRRKNSAYTDYQFPQVMSNGKVVAAKSGIGDISQLVVISGNGAEEKRYVQGIINDAAMLSASGQRVVWNEYRYDPRWLVHTYSVIKGFDFATGKATVISKHSRYSAAALSPDGKKVATLESTQDYINKLVILDYASGGVLQELPIPDNDFLSMPRWTPDGNAIIALRTKSSGRTITRCDLAGGTFIDLLSYSEENIGYPVPYKDFILYNSPGNGIDNIYAVNTETKERFQVTSARYGAYNPAVSPDGTTLYYNNQVKDGMDIVQARLDVSNWKKLEQVPVLDGTSFQHLVEQEGNPNLLSEVTSKGFQSRRYHRASGMFNPHSWGPYFIDGATKVQVGISSRDILSTTVLNAGYVFDIIERTGLWTAGISYQGYYPILDATVFQGVREQKEFFDDREILFEWEEVGTTAGLRVPLYLTRSKYITQVEVGDAVGLTHVTSFTNEITRNYVLVSQGTSRAISANDSLVYIYKDLSDDGNLLSNHFFATYSHNLKQSRRDFNPRFGQSLRFENYSTPFGGDFTGGLTSISGLVYFPGIIKHHSIYFRGGYQYSNTGFETDTYVFRNTIFKPRGYAYPNHQEFLTFQSNYELPLWYPDIAIGPVLNIQRIRTNFFYDYGQGKGSSYFYHKTKPVIYYSNLDAVYNSFGGEVMFDINIMRFLTQLEFGVRTTYITTNKFYLGGVQIEFLIGTIPF